MVASIRKVLCGGAIVALTLAALTLTGPATGADPAKLAEAREELKKAQAEERIGADARNSLDMARAATGAIVTAMREMLGRATSVLREAEEEMKLLNEEAKATAEEMGKETDSAKKKSLQELGAKIAAEQEQLRAILEKRVARVKSYQDQLAKDIGVSDRAIASYNATERKIEQSIVATWNATQRVQEIEAQLAKCATEKVVAEKAAAEKVVAEKTAAAKAAAVKVTAEKDAAKKKALEAAAAKAAADQQAAEKALAARAAAAKAALDKAAAADLTHRQTQVLAAWDAHELAVVQLNRAEQELRRQGTAAKQLAQQAAGEKDPTKKKDLQIAAAKAAQELAAFEKKVAEQRETVRTGPHRVYSLRVAALGGLKPMAPEAWDYAKARHLLVRAGFGGTPQEVQKLHEMGLYKAVDYLVNFHAQPMTDVPFDPVPPPATDPLAQRLRMPGAAGRAQGTVARAAAYNGQDNRLIQWWLKRMVETPRPLQEKLTLFWHGHFATQASVVRHSYATYHHNQLLREHAAGNFGALLYGIAHDPVMIRYLDNNTNVKGHANENLAREIMELFAMGAYQGYNETDVREAARALTGYTFDTQVGQFRFVGSKHDETPKKVFGREGAWTGDDLVQLILEQPATARFVSRKLFEFFVYQDPKNETTDQLAALLRGNNYELAPLLQNLFLSEEFYSAQSMGTQIKCPVQLVVGTLRTLGVKRLADAGPLHTATTAMGQQLLEPPDVKGWRYGRAWVSASRIFVRYNSTAELVRTVAQPEGRRGVDLVALLEGSGSKTAPEVVDYLIKACFLTPLSPESRTKLLDFAKDLPPVEQWAKQRAQVNTKLQNLVVLMISTPDYQVH